MISRTIQIRGEQTLDNLHNAIFDAFDRFDAHRYQFEFGGRKPTDPHSEKYVHPMADAPPEGVGGCMQPTTPSGETGAQPATEASIASLMLRPKQRFFYRFDFGDDWWHWIDVIAISTTIPPGGFPKVIGHVGKSPPQYLGMEE